MPRRHVGGSMSARRRRTTNRGRVCIAAVDEMLSGWRACAWHRSAVRCRARHGHPHRHAALRCATDDAPSCVTSSLTEFPGAPHMRRANAMEACPLTAASRPLSDATREYTPLLAHLTQKKRHIHTTCHFALASTLHGQLPRPDLRLTSARRRARNH